MGELLEEMIVIGLKGLLMLGMCFIVLQCKRDDHEYHLEKLRIENGHKTRDSIQEQDKAKAEGDTALMVGEDSASGHPRHARLSGVHRGSVRRP